MEMINKNEAKLEISMIFVQPSSRLMYFLMGWLLVLGLKDCLVKCATVCVRSMVILLFMILHTKSPGSPKSFHEAPQEATKKLRAEIQK